MIKKAAPDKQGHFNAGFLMVFASTLMLDVLSPHPLAVSLVISMFACAFVAFGKEAVDWVLNYISEQKGESPRHTVEVEDFYCTCGGGLIGAIAAILVSTAARVLLQNMGA